MTYSDNITSMTKSDLQFKASYIRNLEQLEKTQLDIMAEQSNTVRKNIEELYNDSNKIYWTLKNPSSLLAKYGTKSLSVPILQELLEKQKSNLALQKISFNQLDLLKHQVEVHTKLAEHYADCSKMLQDALNKGNFALFNKPLDQLCEPELPSISEAENPVFKIIDDVITTDLSLTHG